VSMFMAIAVFFSQKSYNPKILFTDMLNAWGIKELSVVEKLGNYCFKLEFARAEETARVLEGGSWRHKGDALIVVHYDGLVRPSEVKIDAIQLWTRLYDLPAAMMKEASRKEHGSQLGKYIKMDNRFPGYMRIRVLYPLDKSLLPELKVRIKGRGVINIMLRYENVPHFCFSCGKIGHAAPNCEEEDSAEQGIRFGEELRASPPRRAKEILIKPVAPRTMRSLFQMMAQGASYFHGSQGSYNRLGASGNREGSKAEQLDGHRPRAEPVPDLNIRVTEVLVEGVREMSVEGRKTLSLDVTEKGGVKQRVSFGTNLSTEDESSATESVQKGMQRIDLMVSKLKARKTACAQVTAKSKTAALKVQGPLSKKKQRTPVKSSVVGLMEAMQEDGMEGNSGRDIPANQDSMEEEGTIDVNLPSPDPKNLMGPQDEARQEQ
jgi:hypothetical protein